MNKNCNGNNNKYDNERKTGDYDMLLEQYVYR